MNSIENYIRKSTKDLKKKREESGGNEMKADLVCYQY